VPLDPQQTRVGRTVATLAARERIRELEEQPAIATARGSRQVRSSSEVAREIVALARRYHLVSRETSFVAVERRESPVARPLQLRRVPVALTTGWGGLWPAPPPQAVGKAFARIGTAFTSPGPMPARSCSDGGASSASRLSRSARRAAQAIDQLVSAVTTPGPPAPARTKLAAGGMLRVVGLQHADGSWDLTPEFAAAIASDLAAIEVTLATMHAGSASPAGDRRAWATALAVAWLGRHATGAKDEWSVVDRKARAWLDANSGSLTAQEWLTAATEFLERPLVDRQVPG
jgi:Ca-activated chloride channel family protein